MFFFLFLTAVALFLYYHLHHKRKHLPPGPTPLPILGNTLTISKKSPGYDAYLAWYKEYGPVFTYWLGEIPVVAVADYNLMYEAFVKDAESYAGRFQMTELLDEFRGGSYGVIDTEGDLWKEQRRFTLHVLRDFGVGRNVMQEKILDEVAALIKSVDSDIDGQVRAHDISGHIDTCVGSIINTLLFGYRFDEEHIDEFKKLKSLLNEHLRLITCPAGFAMQAFPFKVSKHLPWTGAVYKEMMSNRDVLFGYFRKQIQKHKNEIDFSNLEESTDYVEAYLKAMQKNSASDHYNDIQLANVCFDLWIAGMETTSNTISWGVVYLLNNIHIQEKIHNELDTVIGSDRLITLADKNDLVYLNAFVNEVQRAANLVPQNLLHRTTRQVVLNGMTIPQGTCIIPQISCALLDDRVFDNPYEFRPERFIEDGQLKKIDQLVPFSMGKRQCLGESLARMELFLITANLMNQYKFSLSGSVPPSIKKRLGITVQALPYTCKIERRKQC
ncbi:hypothetical protein QR680_001552 [Steinernema hermaphroditum]|uniref:CYtochrome P450 family n=1 Tax=Steinernema hermaphroditum TaxID=289476 RepID=A0AA39H0T6_9BILA|nr:hypothetical protein QR680_001552 [Steinernema hermaphroditum]